MTRDEIIAMAKEAGLGFKKGSGWGTHAGTQRFAALVAAAEREACAKVCDATVMQSVLNSYDAGWAGGAETCAAAIRSRGSV